MSEKCIGGMNMFLCMCVRLCIVCVCMYVCMYVCVVCMCVCVCMYCNSARKKKQRKGNCVCVCHLSVRVTCNITYNRVNTTR